MIKQITLYPALALLWVLILPGGLLHAQAPQLFGTTTIGGGVYGNGTIYSMTGDSTGYDVAFRFGYLNPGANPIKTRLLPGANGILYGMTYIGGANNLGVIFSFDTATNNYQVLHNFNKYTAQQPKNSLVRADNNCLYGLTYSNYGIFCFNPDSGTYRHITRFGIAVGSTPEGSLFKASDGMLYGTTASGGLYQYGTIFKLDPVSGVLDTVHAFQTPTVAGANAKGTFVQATNGLLYSTIERGGTYGSGLLFSFNPVTSVYTEVHHFGNGSSSADNPTSELLLGQDGKIYGMTSAGGVSGAGAIFSYDPVTGQYEDLYSFKVVTGYQPQGGLTQDNNGVLYGMTRDGALGFGTLFSFNPGTKTFTNLYNFTNNNGSWPQGTPTLLGNKLYGLTTFGGYQDAGVIFSYNLGTNTYTKILDLNKNTGIQSTHTMVEATDGLLYGTTDKGGQYGKGILFSYDPTYKVFKTVVDINDTTLHPNLQFASNNGKLYFTSTIDGKRGTGRILSYDTKTGINKVEYDSIGGGIMQASNGLIYGVGRESNSGSSDKILFSFDPATGKCKRLFKNRELTSILPSRQNISTNSYLTEADNGKLYGSYAASEGLGLFCYDVANDTLTCPYYKINNSGGSTFVEANIRGKLTKAFDGKLYGIFSAGPNINNNAQGGIFKFDTDSNLFSVPYYFTSFGVHRSTVGSPTGTLLLASDGNLYNSFSGSDPSGNIFMPNLGMIYRFNPVTNIVDDIQRFDSTDGIHPIAGLVEYKCVDKLTTLDENICKGGSYTFKGQTLTAAGIYKDTIPTISGCDSMITLNLSILPDSADIHTSICFGEAYRLGNLTLREPGNYSAAIQNSLGCDSFVKLQLSVLPESASSLSRTICNKASFTFNGVARTSTGDYKDTLTSVTGCDSIITLHLTALPAIATTFDQTICYKESYMFNGIARKTNGDYKDTLQNVNGCDSLITLRLTVLPQIITNTQSIICRGDSLAFNGQFLKYSGTYYDTLQNGIGCDSIIKLQFTAYTIITFYTFNSVENKFTATMAGTNHWLDCQTGIVLDTTRTFTPTKSGLYALAVNQYGCIDTSACEQVTILITGNEPLTDKNEISIYPNPTTGSWLLQADNSLAGQACELLDNNSQVVYRLLITGTSTEIPGNVPPGIYFLRIYSDKESFTRKLVKLQ